MVNIKITGPMGSGKTLLSRLITENPSVEAGPVHTTKAAFGSRREESVEGKLKMHGEEFPFRLVITEG